jgi:fructuronate reductase
MAVCNLTELGMTCEPSIVRLNRANLSALAGSIGQPPAQLDTAPGVVHLGLGAFHRAHQALVFDSLLRSGDKRWGVLGVAMRNAALADALAAQDGLYSVQIASQQGRHWALCAALQTTAVAAREPQRVVEALAAKSTRWVTLTITEKGYGSELVALLGTALVQRHAAGHAGLTIASCDNLSNNGRQLQALCMNWAQQTQQSKAFIEWLHNACAFPCSMVDRIVPAATPAHAHAAQEALQLQDACALGTEAFWEWVIERRFADPADEQALSAHGVQVVDDVQVFEQAKLRMLNGSHSAMACIGAVAGLPTIADCIGQSEVNRFIHGLMTQEIIPHLARSDGPAYREALLQRFANPSLLHSVHQIATDSSLKIPLRWRPCAELRLDSGGSFLHLAFAAAAWMRYARGVDDHGQTYALSDPMAQTVQTLAQQHAGDAPATVAALCTLPSIWGANLPASRAWQAAVTAALQRIESQGMLAALATENFL